VHSSIPSVPGMPSRVERATSIKAEGTASLKVPRSWSTFLIVQLATEAMPRATYRVALAEGIAQA